MAAAVTVTGDKQIDRALARFEPSLQNKFVSKATRASAKIVASKAVARAPYDSGELERSIKVRALRRSRTRRGHGVDSGTKQGIDEGLPYYTQFLEYGTTTRHHKSGKSVGRIQPGEHDFLRTALYESEGEVKATFIAELRRWIRGGLK